MLSNRAAIMIGVISLLVSPVAATNYGEFGMGFQHPSAPTGTTDKLKFVEFGHVDSLPVFERLIGVGGWTDQTRYPGTRSSAYALAALGLETRSPGFYVSYFLGPAFVTAPDVLLGSWFQVSHELGFGYKDYRGVGIGIVVKHFSDGGLSTRNYGRNFVGIRARF